jgi:hypothetical protein
MIGNLKTKPVLSISIHYHLFAAGEAVTKSNDASFRNTLAKPTVQSLDPFPAS